MDYITRYYKNLSEKLAERLQLLESILPGVRPAGSTKFPSTRLLTPEEREEGTPTYDLLGKTPDLGLLGKQDWYTKAKDSYWRSPQGQRRSAQMTAGFRASANAIGEVGQQMAALSDKYSQPAPTTQPTRPSPTATQTPNWLAGLQADVNKAVAAKPAEPRRDYREVAREAQRNVEARNLKLDQMAGRVPPTKPEPTTATKPVAPQPTITTSAETRTQPTVAAPTSPTTGRKAAPTTPTQTSSADNLDSVLAQSERRRVEAKYQEERTKAAESLAMSAFKTKSSRPPTLEERLAAEAERARRSTAIKLGDRYKQKEDLDKAALQRFREQKAAQQRDEQAKAEEQARKREEYLAWKMKQQGKL